MEESSDLTLKETWIEERREASIWTPKPDSPESFQNQECVSLYSESNENVTIISDSSTFCHDNSLFVCTTPKSETSANKNFFSLEPLDLNIDFGEESCDSGVCMEAFETKFQAQQPEEAYGFSIEQVLLESGNQDQLAIDASNGNNDNNVTLDSESYEQDWHIMRPVPLRPVIASNFDSQFLASENNRYHIPSKSNQAYSLAPPVGFFRLPGSGLFPIPAANQYDLLLYGSLPQDEITVPLINNYYSCYGQQTVDPQSSMHECDYCEHAFSTLTEMETHQKVHVGKRPFTCTRCPARFSTKGSLRRHIRRHVNHRPFICEQCGRAFGEKQTLKVHMRVHTGEKPYGCYMCGRHFSQRSTLKRHEFTHDGVRGRYAKQS